MHQALAEEPALSAKSKDKFLVQSALLTPETQPLDNHAVWSAIPSQDVSEQKVRVAWLGGESPAGRESHPPPAAAAAAGGAGVGAVGAGAAGAATATGAQQQQQPVAGAPSAGPTTAVPPTSARSSLPAYSAVDASQAPPLQEKSATANGVSSDAENQARISQLQRQLATAQAEKGIPVQQVALLATLVFFVTYFFF